MSALHRQKRHEGAGLHDQRHQEQALLLTLLQGRDPDLYARLYGQRHASGSGKNVVMLFN